MRRKMLAAALAVLACAIIACAAPAQAQPTTLWVSGITGLDSNACSRTAPCLTFAGAFAKSTTGGQINCLDPGAFGPVTITFSLTIDCTGTRGSVPTFSQTGIVINGAGANVTLRGLDLQGDLQSPQGIRFIVGAGLTVKDTVIQRFNNGNGAPVPAAGIQFTPNSAATLQLSNVTLLNNGISPTSGGGLIVNPSAGGSAVVIANNVRIENNAHGILVNSANGFVVMTLRNSTIANNTGDGINTNATNTILMMVDRTTISANFQTGVTSGGGNSVVRLNNTVIAGNAAAVSGAVRSFGNNTLRGNGSGDGTLLTLDTVD